MSYLRQSGRLSSSIEVPLLVLLLGILLLAAHHPKIPLPAWLKGSAER